MKITKASGMVEDLRPEKLKASLMRSGADEEAAEEIIERVMKEIEPYAGTGRIYRLVRKYLRRYNHASSLRYSLKKAIFRLGPTGYPFEKYFGEILKNYGNDVKVDTIINGRCVKHEVDVVAVGDREVSVVECKYHNTTGRTSDVKVAMYVHSRFRDLEPVFKSMYPGRSFSGWLVTNTRFTSDAVRYAECSGLKIVGWRYPDNGSLEKMIEDKLLYPVTVISGIKKGLIKDLISRNIVLLKDLTEMDTDDIQSMFSLSKGKAVALKEQADSLCLC